MKLLYGLLLLLLYCTYILQVDGFPSGLIRLPVARYDASLFMAAAGGRDSFIASNKVVRKLRYVSVEDRAKVSIYQ